MTVRTPDRARRVRVLSLKTNSTNAADRPGEDRRPALKLINDMAVMVDRVVQILAAIDGVFQRHGLLVRVSRSIPSDDRATPIVRVEPMERSAVPDVVSRHVRVLKAKSVGGTIEWQPAVLPGWATTTVIERGAWPGVPELKAIGYAPHLLPDGRVLQDAGFHADDGVLLEFSERFTPLPTRPRHKDAVQAADRLLAWSRDFPFVAECDRSALLAAILTVVARRAVLGPAPMFVVRATTPGSGKTLLAQVLSVLATGHETSPVVFGTDEASTRKAILSIGIRGSGVVLLDNVEGSLGSPSLAAALTSVDFTDRMLGVSRMVTVDLGGITWVVTGNNLRLRGDLGRRVIPIDLDAGVEHPEDLTGFAIENLLDHVRENRARLIIDALTVLRAYHRAGSPRHGGPRIGSFEKWDDLIRGAVIWTGIGDPTAGRSRLREDGDSDLDALRMLLHAWEQALPAPATVREIIEHIQRDESSDLGDALAELLPDGALSTRALAYVLRRHHGRIVDGLRLVHSGARSSLGYRWKVERIDQRESADGADRPGARD